MATTFKFGNKNWAVKEDYVLAYNDENDNFKPLPFDFTRATTATYLDSDGLIKTANAGHARIDYLDNTDGHLLLEPSRTNLLLRSEDYTTTWSKTNGSVTANQTTAPDGTQTADLFQENTATGSHDIRQNKAGLTASTTYTYSIFVKEYSAGSTRRIAFYIGGINSSGEFDFSQEAFLSNHSFDSADAIYYGNGWYRLIITDTTTGTSFNNIIILDNGSTSSYAGDGSSGIYLWGAQLEQGSYPTSYIPTEGSSVTRNADVCNGAGSSDVFNDSEGVLFVETEPFIDGDFESQYISLQDGTTGNNFVTIQHRDNGQLRVYAGGFNTANIQFLQNLDMAQNLKIAVQYKESDYKLFVNGTEYSLYSSGGNEPAVSGLSELSFTVRGGTSNKWLGKTKQLKVYNTALSDSELETLTT